MENFEEFKLENGEYGQSFVGMIVKLSFNTFDFKLTEIFFQRVT